MTSTNYFNTLIEIAEDCPVAVGEVPPVKGDKKSVANLQFEMLYKQPYTYTSDDVLFSIFAKGKAILLDELANERDKFFSKGQPCLRASPLPKRYGWGVHADENGKIALFAVDSDKYKELKEDDSVIKVKAMRSKRA